MDDEPQYFPPWVRLDGSRTPEVRFAEAMQVLEDIMDRIARTEKTRDVVRAMNNYERRNGPGWRT